MKQIRTPAAMLRLVESWQQKQSINRPQAPLVFVPTMGALHRGHTALIEKARKVAGAHGKVVVSIFVNPLQFGPKEDLSKYPRPLKHDLLLCSQYGADAVFLPQPATMYVPDQSVFINEELLSLKLCGHSRPGHFRGVCTVVAKLFNIVNPSVAIFGEKDYQQLAIIRRMVRDLNFPIKIIGHPTIREKDGLAMSSRNVYLCKEERVQAPIIRHTLLQAKQLAKESKSLTQIQAFIKKSLSTVSLARIDYIEILDAHSLQPVKKIESPVVCAVAVFFGSTRLIDNITFSNK